MTKQGSASVASKDKTGSIRVFIVLLGILSIALCIYISLSIWSSSKQDAYTQFYEESASLEYRLSRQLESIVQIAINNVNLAAKSPLLPLSLKTNETSMLQRSWTNMFNSSPSLYQIRLIDLSGNEVFRMEKSLQGYKWAAPDALQYKGDRDYFLEGISSPETVYISALDLNKENGVIEQPLRPTIRATAKYIENGDVRGLVVLNYDLRSEFEFFKQQQTRLSHWIVKENGYFLSTPNAQAWGWLLNKPKANAQNIFGEELVTQIREGESTFDIAEEHHVIKVDIANEGLQANLAEDRFWFILQFPENAQAKLAKIKTNLSLITFFTISLIILVALYIDRLIVSMRKKELAAIELAELAGQSERTKSKFLAQMSHEIRTPMNGVFGLLQLTYGERNQQKINDNLRTAIRSFESLRRIIDDILDFSKIEAGKLKLVSQVFEIDIALRDVSQNMSRAAYGKNIDMWIDIDPACPRECMGDPVRLNQILFNLSNNAIKFTEQGEIRLTLSLLCETETKYQLGIEITDTGIGMSEQESNEIFEAFTQASDRTHGKYGGTGLGLAIVKQLVNLMEGEIEVSSTRGKGTQFKLDVWLDKSSNTARFSDPLTNQDSKSAEVYILACTDHARSILKKHCSSLGWLGRNIRNLNDLSKLKFTNNDNIKILLVESKDALDEELIEQLHESKNNYPNLLFVQLGSHWAKIKHGEDNIFDIIIDKPITPSELYDQLIPYTQLTLETANSSGKVNNNKLDNKHILLVEDNDINQMVAMTMLQNAGAEVTVANNGLECLQLLDELKLPVSLILMDMQMPVMDGITAAEEIRKRDAFKNIPIVALTANAMEEDIQACINAGMQDHVSKPIDANELIQTVLKNL